MRADPPSAELQRLDPESRALIELSVIRGLPDEDLAEMLGMEAGRLRALREGVLRDLGAESAAEREALVRSLREGVPEARTEDPAGPRPAAEPAPSGEPASPVAGKPRRRRRTVIALGGGLAIALLVALVLALRADDSPVFRDAPDPVGAGAPRTERLEAVGGGEGAGTARITEAEGRRVLQVSARGLPRPAEGGYVIWLYDSPSRARALTGSRRGTFTLRQPLPPNFDRYRFVDVSREPADGNLDHNGPSVLRVPLEQIPGP